MGSMDLPGNKPKPRTATPLAWRLLSLFRHPDKDVQRGAIGQWVALFGRAGRWLEREAFGEPGKADLSPLVFDWQPLNAGNLLPSSYESWVSAYFEEGRPLLESTLGQHGKEEDELPTGALGVRFENCNYAGIVTRMLQPILPIFFAVQFNFLYDGYKNEFGLDLKSGLPLFILGVSILAVVV